jgi:hypothetical protein
MGNDLNEKTTTRKEKTKHAEIMREAILMAFDGEEGIKAALRDKDFIATQKFVKNFETRAKSLRPMFGLWDACDPISHALLDVVEAQRKVSDLYDDAADYGNFADEEFVAALKRRYAAGEKLMRALRDRGVSLDDNLDRLL